MNINETDFIKDPEKYLELCATEEIIITRDGTKIARLTGTEEYRENTNCDLNVREQVECYDIHPRTVTYEEFLAIAENSEKRYEYIDGEIYQLASPKTTHQKILGKLYLTFSRWFEGKTCQPMLSPFDITLKRNKTNINVVQPDLMVICDLEEKLNEKDDYTGIPTLLVEIISESTRRNGCLKKLDLYMSAGVREYWIINPSNREVVVYLFQDHDFYKDVTYKNGETAVSFCFHGLSVSLEEIFH